jgi:hypothetical protein
MSQGNLLGLSREELENLAEAAAANMSDNN